MGYGFGGLLTALGLVLALAVRDGVEAVDLTMVGWILTAVGVCILLFTAYTLNSRRRSVATTTHADGSQTVHEQQSTT